MGKALNLAVLLSGIALVVIGGGVGLGGFLTLGLQIPTDFIEVTKSGVFDVQDNHTRYLGGFFFMAGLVCVYGAFSLKTMRRTLIVLCIMIAGAAVFRFLGGNANPLSAELLPSLIAEIILAPALAFWLWRTKQGKMN